jgi:probable rRNA maturation factor
VTENSKLSVDVQIACDDPGIPEQDDIRTWVRLAVSGSRRVANRDAELAVRVVESEEIRALNHLYRHQDKATNVLSFPAGDVDGLPADEPLMLGDVVVCASIVSAEAAAQGKILADHWAHMLVHGTLHLLGFDHESDAEAAEMEAMEITLLAVKGITDPYVAT